jgi:alkylhydroperoxidase/carboxymuconolactone decarboxylase family protein YurZ
MVSIDARIGAKSAATVGESSMNGESPHAELLRRLALNDERVLSAVMSASANEKIEVSAKLRALFQIAALVAGEPSVAAYKWAVTTALAEGATEGEVVSALVSVAPIVGSARVTVAAPVLAAALGYEVDPLTGP